MLACARATDSSDVDLLRCLSWKGLDSVRAHELSVLLSRLLERQETRTVAELMIHEVYSPATRALTAGTDVGLS